jgi:hypothetical protein
VPHRICVVSFIDSEGLEHAVQIAAASLYEAAVLAMAEFRRRGFAEMHFGPATRLKISVKAPEAEHVVSIGKVQSWLDGGAASPIERIEKNRLKKLLSQ